MTMNLFKVVKNSFGRKRGILFGNSQGLSHYIKAEGTSEAVRHRNYLSAFVFLYLLIQQKFFLFKLLINLYDATVFARSEVGKKCLKNRTRATQSKNCHQMVYKCAWLLTLQTLSAMV